MARGRRKHWARVIHDGNGKPLIYLDENDEPRYWDMDLGLGIGATHCRFGEPHTSEWIAAFCGVTRQRIDQIEKKAMRTVRTRLHRIPGLWDELEYYISKLGQAAQTIGCGKNKQNHKNFLP